MEQKINHSFLEKLKGLGVQVGTYNLSGQKQATYSIRDVMEGYEIETPLGTTFAVEKIFPCGSVHGNIDLFNLKDLHIIQQWAQIPQNSRGKIEQFLFLDTETSGLAGGAGTFVFMVGMGYYSGSNFKVIQLFLEDPEFELAFLSSLEKITAGFDTLVTFNGKSFDVPVLKNRYLISHSPHPFDDFHHIDLLHLSRRLWKKRLASCRLSELEQEVLDFKRSEDEIPGWLVPEIYHDYLYSGDARPLAGVFYHNQNDVVSMAALTNVISKMLSNPYEIINPDDLMAVGKFMDDLSIFSSAHQIYEYCENLNYSAEKEIELLLRIAVLYQHQSQLERAIIYLEAAVRLGSIPASIQVSKYYEHHKKDYGKALHYAEIALEQVINSMVNSPKIPPQAEVGRRINRIRDKMNRNNVEKENG